MQPWRTKTTRAWKDVSSTPSHSITQRNKKGRKAKDPLWLDACIKLEETLNLENERDIATLIKSNADNDAETASKSLSIVRLRQAEGANQTEDGNEDGKALSNARLRQALVVDNGSGVRVRKFLAMGASHQACDQGFGADTGTLQAIQTSHNGLVHHFVCKKPPPCEISHAFQHCDEGQYASAGNITCIATLCQAKDNNGHDANVSQSQKNLAYKAASKWTLPILEEALNDLEKGALPCPPFEDIACLLHKCSSSRNQQHALRLYAYMCQNGLDSQEALGNRLVSMLAEAGCLQDALQIFDRLLFRSKLSWDSLITGHIKQGDLYDALSLYQKMSKDESFCCSSSTFVLLLKACARLKDVKTGAALHAKVAELGLLLRDGFVANSLVDMYAKCGAFVKGRRVLERLRIRDVIAWTALITGYANHGHAEKALQCYETMQLEGVVPDKVILVCVLRACGSAGAVGKIQEIHEEIERIGLVEKDVAIGTILIEIYASCNVLSRAQEVFDKLHNRDVISWTALILGYSEHGHGKEALKCYDKMQCDGISPDLVTFMCILKASSSLGDLDRILKIHAQVERAGLLAGDNVVGSMLVDVYGKCGALDKALQAFNQLQVRDVVPWTALIEGYTEHGHGENAIQCFEQMQIEGVPPNAITLSCSLKACGSVGTTIEGQKIHLQVENRGLLKRNLIVGNALVDMYTKCSVLDKAQQVFDKLHVRNVVSWTSLIAGYVEHGHGETALKCFDQMQLEGVAPNALTCTFCLKACGIIGAVEKGAEIHAEIDNDGLLERDAMVGNALVDMYARFGMFTQAQEVFKKLPNQSVVSWTSLIARLAEQGHAEESIDTFEQMQRRCVFPNDVTFVTILKVCGGIGAVNKVRELHAEVERLGLSDSELVGNTLVHIYAKCGLLAFAQEVFKKLPVRDVVSWNSLIAGYNRLGEAGHALSTFDGMLCEGVRPGSITFTTVLSACSRQGLLNESHKSFQALGEEYGVVLAPEHQCSVLDAFCRAGEFDKAKAFLQMMENGSNLVMWHSLLSACKNFQNADFGKWAFDHALHLDVQDAASYALMCQLYGILSPRGEKRSQADQSRLEQKTLPLPA